MFPRNSFSNAVTDIQSLLGDADPATGDLDDATRAWLAHIRQAITAQQRAPSRRVRDAVPHRAPRRRQRRLAAAGALAAAAALTAVVVLAPLPATAPGASPAAARLLAKIAAAAARQPTPQLRNNQFWYIKSWGASIGCNAATGQCVLGKPGEAQIWQSVSNLCLTGLLREHGQNIPLIYDGNRQHCPDRGGMNDPTYRFLQSLPTNPHALLSLIERQMSGQQPPPHEAFITIGDLLGGSIAPPLVTAALYRAAALIPGVTMVADATDAIGRHGVGVAMTIEDVRYEWIFSSHTLRYLGERDIYVTKPRDLHITPGSIASESAVLQRAFVNHPGQTPASSSR
jgi:hypothetical protein